jgi:hypothetical protein
MRFPFSAVAPLMAGPVKVKVAGASSAATMALASSTPPVEEVDGDGTGVGATDGDGTAEGATDGGATDGDGLLPCEQPATMSAMAAKLSHARRKGNVDLLDIGPSEKPGYYVHNIMIDVNGGRDPKTAAPPRDVSR